jgi:hypothetical protein
MPDKYSRPPDFAVVPDAHTLPVEPEPSPLSTLVVVVRQYARVLQIGLAAVSAAVLLLLIAAYVLMPADRYAAIAFRALFAGAETGTYPNGTKFSGSDIVSAPVLNEVYKRDDLQRYVTFEQFKNAMFVLQSNPAMQLLGFEYDAKLADSKLTPAERARIEEEYKKKRESLNVAEFSLNFRRSERFSKLSSTLVASVLTGTLEEWARQARELKGALKYDIAVYSRNILQPELLTTEDYIVATDVLRAKVNSIIGNIDSIAAIPGAALIRTGKTEVSLAEIRLRLNDLLRFDIEPSITLITRERLTRDPQRARVYVQDQLRQVALDRQTSEQRIRAIQEPLRDYVTLNANRQPADSGGRGAQPPLSTQALIPQLGESFLQQIVDLSKQNSDAQYRQGLTDRVIDEGLQAASSERERAYYENLARAIGEWGKSGESPASKEVIARVAKAYDTVALSLDQIGAIYEQLSAKNLNPATLLYQATTPVYQISERSVSLVRLLLFGVIGWLVLIAGLVAGCLAHAQYRRVSGPAVPARELKRPEHV